MIYIVLNFCLIFICLFVRIESDNPVKNIKFSGYSKSKWVKIESTWATDYTNKTDRVTNTF